ncbi:MAG: hypothetical protein DRI90_01510, partial [Deltaproteobacteria bacterium]
MRLIPISSLLLLGCAACSAPPPPRDVPATAEPATPQPSATPSTPASAETSDSQAVAPTSIACGELNCRLFDSPVDAVRAVLKEGTQVLAIGES